MSEMLYPKLRGEIDRLKLDLAGHGITIDAQQVVIANLERQIAALRAALEPFARQAKIIDENDKLAGFGPEPDFRPFTFSGSYTGISLGDCRKAREVLDADQVRVVS